MVTYINMLPSKNVISYNLSLSAIILGTPNPDCYKFKIRFGAYEQLHIGTKNKKNHRTVGEMALLSTHEQGGY